MRRRPRSRPPEDDTPAAWCRLRRDRRSVAAPGGHDGRCDIHQDVTGAMVVQG